MKDRIYSSDTEKWVSTALCVCVFAFILIVMFYPPFKQKHLNVLLSPFLVFLSVICNLIDPTHYMLDPRVVITAYCVYLCVCVCIDNSFSLPTGGGGADLRGLAEYLLGPATTNQASDAGWPRANPTTPLLYVLALGLQSGQSRVRGPDRSVTPHWPEMVIDSRPAGADIDYV